MLNNNFTVFFKKAKYFFDLFRNSKNNVSTEANIFEIY